MKTQIVTRPWRAALSLAVLLSLPALGLAAPPDLTVAGAIASLKTDTSASPVYSQTYNLGATGLRGWIYIDNSGGNVGPDDLITDPSRQILVTVASAPGNAVLAVDDLILGAMAGSSGTVPLFTSDCRKAFGAAITAAEATGAGTLRVKRWRAGTTTDVNIAMTIMGNYADAAPYSCPKSAVILANARDQLVSQLYANANFLTNDWGGAINGLALMASVQPGYVHPTLPTATYAYVQSRLQTFARSVATTGPQQSSLFVWNWGYVGVFLSEYYLRTVADGTPDANVVTGLNNYTVAIAQVQSRYGTYGHGGSLLNADGSWHGTVGPYGPVNQTGIVANIAIVIGKKALLAAGQPINAEIDPAILRGGNFFAWYVNKGPIPYGEHEPFIAGHAPNGKDASCAVLFGLQDTRTTETEYFTRMTTAGFTGREYGHTGQGFSYLWGAMGANMGGAAAVASYLKPIRWHLDLERRTDGSFVYDGGEQYGAGSTGDGSYLGSSGYYGMNPTASYILTYGLPLQRLYITGRNANPANTLDATKVAAAVAAATYDVDCHSFSIGQLITDLSNFDPCVRYYAATELGTRSLGSADLTTLRTMVGDMTNANGRQGACQALGLLKDSASLSLLTQHLDKTIEPDSWVRAKAASAIRMYPPATASTQLTPMLTAFAANATDPNVIAWDDPIQISNNYLNFALFGDAVYGNQVNGGANLGAYSINAAKSLLYPAVKAGLKQPDSNSRFGTANFCYNYLTLADVQALFPDLIQVVETESQADTMWSMNPRAKGIATLAKYKIAEGIAEALNMQVVPTGFGWNSDGFQVPGLNALTAYGDAARWTLPTLQGYLTTWDPTSTQYATLASTITSIQAAITTPAENLGLAVANPQVVATTGAKAITLTGTSPRGSVSFTSVTAPAHGTLTGTAPNLTYTPDAGFTGPDYFTFVVTDSLTTSTPGTVSVIVGTAGAGLKGEYYDNIDFTNLKVTRIDPQVNFDWGTGSPDPSIGADTFSVRWSGLLLVPETGTYMFSTLNSDGVRLYINGVLVIDDYTTQATNWTDGTKVNLTAGQMVDIQMEYYENTGSAVAKLKWTGPSFAGANGTIIGSQWLYDGTGVARTPYAHDQSETLVQNSSQAITLTGSGGTLGYVILTQPAHGVLTGTAPNLTYTPTSGYSGSDSFTFLVNNGSSNSTPATVSLSVLAGLPVSFTWAGATTGNWSLGTNWSGSAAPAAAGQPYYSLNFTPSGTYTVTNDLNNGFLLNQLNLAGLITLAGTNSIAFAANGSLLPQFNQTSANAVIVNTPLTLNAMTNFGGTGGGQVTINSLISGTGGLTKNNAGTLTLNNTTNTYSGGTVLNDGIVNFPAGNGALTPFFGTGPVTVNPNANLQVNRTSLSNAINLNGTTVSGGNSFQSSFSGPVTLTGITTFSFGTTGGFTIPGSISGSGGLTTTGTTLWHMSGSNSYTGPTSILAGTISFDTAAAVPPGALSISSGAIAKLNYSGNRVISSLTIAGATMPAGSYGSSSSSATNKNNTCFSGSGMVTILPATTTALALTSGATPASPGTSLTFTATVTGSSPTGTVVFFAGSTQLGTGTLNGSRQASLTTNSLALGSYNITAQYAGNATNAASTSSPLAIVIASSLALPPTNLLAAAGNNHVALSWTLSAGAIGYNLKRATVSGGPYTVIANPGSGNADDLTATNGTTYYYVVSAINASGESANSSQVSGTPAALPSTTTLVSSPPGTGTYGTVVTFTATVSGAGGSATGVVTFIDGATVLGTGTLSSGTASFTTSALAVGNHSVTASYAGDASYSASISSPSAYAVTVKGLTITGVTASNKVYDTGATAVLTGGTLVGVANGDTVTVAAGSGTFASTNAGTWAVTASGYSLSGANAGNYVLSAQPAVANATILPKPLTLSATPAVADKTYDGLTTATVSGATLLTAEAAGSGNSGDGKPYTGDTVTLTLSGAFSTKDAGNGKAVTSTSTLGGAQAANYSLTQPAGLTASIAPKALALSATPTVAGKNYDGLTTATLSGAALLAAEAAGTGTAGDGKPYTGDTVTLVLSGTFDTKDIGTGKTVTSTSSLSGAQAGDYTLTQPTGLTGTISAAVLTITAGNQSKTYGQTLVFGSGATQFSSTGLQHGETIGSVTLACAGGDPAAAVGFYPITPSAATGGTFIAGNYAISYVAGALTVSITIQTLPKAATGTDLTAGASWGGTAPGATDMAYWTTNSLGAGLTLGGSSAWGGIGVGPAVSAITVTGAGPLTLGAGGIDMSAATTNLTWSTPITLGASQTWNVNLNRTLNPTGVISGAGIGLIKAGMGTLTLNGSAVNTFNGGLAVNGGTLLEDLSQLATPTNLLNNGNSLTLAGGTLSLKGKSSAVTSQTFASTTVNSGGSVVTLTQNSATSLTAVLASITRNAGGTLNFSVVPGTSGVIATTTSSNEGSGILGPWASVGTTTTLQYATVNGSGQVVTYPGATTTTQPANLSDVTSASVNYAFGATVAPTQTAAITGNTLRFTGTTAGTLANGGFTTTLNGLMNAGTAALTVSGAGNLVIGPNKELVILANAQGITISSTTTPFTKIVDNAAGPSSLVYSGAGGTLTLNCATNTYSGGTLINSGTLTTAATGNVTDTYFGTGPVTINPGATLALNKTYVANALTLNNASVSSGNSFSSTLAGAITLTGITTVNITGNLSIPGNISGTGGLTKTGSANVPVTGTNNYTGPTTIGAGPLTFSKPAALYNGTTAFWTPANLTVASGATLGVNFGGASDFSNAQVTALLANLTTGVSYNGLLAGSAIGFDTTNGNGTFSGTITDSQGPGGGSVGVNKYGSANPLTLSGNNTFSGPVSVGGPPGTSGGTLKVYSFNSVNGGTPLMASSSLGCPTTVTSGTITCGNASSNQGVGITYLGSGETTDRVLAMNAGTSGTALTLDQSGTGALKFSSAFVYTGATGSRTLALQGSTTGTGELGGILANPSASGYLSVTKSGTGTWTLSGANTYAPVSAAGGVTTVSGGCLVLGNANALPGGIGTTGGISPLTFSGGVIGLGAGDFTRPLAAAGTATGACFSATAGGWAAYGADRIVNLGGASATITWATASTGLNGLILILGNATATNMVDFQNGLDLGSAARTIQVDHGSAAVDGKLSGNITGVAGGNLTKTGGGTLALAGSNNYAGTTTVSTGTLLVNGSNSGTGLVTVSSGATLGGTGSLGGAATFISGGKAVFTVTRDAGTGANTTPLTITGVMTYNSTVVHLTLPTNLPWGTYTLATSSAPPVGTVAATPVIDSGSIVAGYTSAVVSLDTANKRLLLTVTGPPPAPTALAITSINGGVSPTAGLPFSVGVQAVDGNNTPLNVTQDTVVSLTLATGTGSLLGNLVGTITASGNSTTLSGVMYSTAETGVSLTASATSGASLTAALSAAFTVLPNITPTYLTVTGFPSPLTPGTAGSLTVTAHTPAGAVATTYTGTVHFTSTSALAGLPADYTFVSGDNGVHVFTGVTLNTLGLQSITATDTVTPSINGTQSAITVWTLPISFTWRNGVSGNWSDPTSWAQSSGYNYAPLAGGEADYSLNFIAGTYIANHDLGDGFFANQLNFAGTVTLAGGNDVVLAGALPAINQNSAGGVVIALPVIIAVNTTVAGSGGGPVDLAGTVAGAGGLTKTSAGVLKIDGLTPNTYSGGTVVNNGTLHVGTMIGGTSPLCAGVLGTGPVTLGSGAILELDHITASNYLFSHGGTIHAQNSTDVATLSGPITLDTDTTVQADFPLACSGAISGAGGLVKTGNGPLILSSANTYAGTTTVTGGTLQCDVTDALGAGALSIGAGAKVNLNHAGSKAVASLTLGGVAQTAAGTYGTTASGASHPNDAYFSGTGTVAVGTGYDVWANGSFANGSLTDKNPDHDPLGSGMTNYQKFAFGLDPTSAISFNPISQPLDPATGTFKYTRTKDSGLTYTVKTSTDLVTWMIDAGAGPQSVTTNGTVETVEFTVTNTPVNGVLFVRVEAAP